MGRSGEGRSYSVWTAALPDHCRTPACGRHTAQRHLRAVSKCPTAADTVAPANACGGRVMVNLEAVLRIVSSITALLVPCDRSCQAETHTIKCHSPALPARARGGHSLAASPAETSWIRGRYVHPGRIIASLMVKRQESLQDGGRRAARPSETRQPTERRRSV